MTGKLITSKLNPIFNELKKLLTSKGIHKQNRFLVWGEKFTTEIANEYPEVIALSIIGSKHIRPKDSYIELSNELFAELDIFGTNSPILVCQTPDILKMKRPHPNGLELLVAVSEPSNLGAIIRSAVAFGVKKIILLKESSSPFHPKAVRAAAGNTLKLQYELGPSIAELEPNLLAHCVALDMAGEDLRHFKWAQNSYLLVGEEGRGIPSTMKIKKVHIPMNSKIESLNAAIAISIAMYSHFVQNK